MERTLYLGREREENETRGRTKKGKMIKQEGRKETGTKDRGFPREKPQGQ